METTSLISSTVKCVISGDNISTDVLNTIKSGNNRLNPAVVDEDIIKCEILRRLPVKSLMRFKSVSKPWLSLIEDDPYFADLHFAQSKARTALLLVIPCRRDPNDRSKVINEIYLTANLSSDGSKAEIHSVRKADEFSCHEFCGPLNGLICFLDRHSSDVHLYNISTEEVIPRVRSLPIHCLSSFSHDTYEFGFDPVTKKYKVLCVRHINRQPNRKFGGDWYQVCEVLTIGDNAWRRIDEVPRGDFYFTSHSIYVNGSIYYFTNKFICGNWDCNDAVLVAFDVGSEKFRVIPIPNLILNNPPSDRYLIAELSEVDGHVAVCCRNTNYIAKLWVYIEGNDYDNEWKLSKTSKFGNCEKNWIEHTITLPFPWDNRQRLSIYTGAGRHQILMQQFYKQQYPDGIDSVNLYSYDLKKKTFTDIKVTGIPSSIPNDCCIKLASTFVESLFPIQKLRTTSEAPLEYSSRD